MAITKAEILGRLTQDQEAAASALEATIDAEIRRNYVGRELVVTISHWPHERIRQELERRYREAGWILSFHSDQRDGSWITVS
ncbi:MAG: hypothetical protein A2991_01765 [Candidatus Terrybacteria bacterium RIFCSPLOWO2_01_FULL_58_14]|uniref:Smr domain-containing protein n=2 Tax=Candidatus Terryibacteriota TaxID=1817920 RepID=A0A1G2PZT8_9BACT|nr:MAG: hypothetical protein A2682_02110 [Candidatus Terrybacteria bacterium RIFCSPHIGHO2_01_FULL_58_15]OHA53279.1 MAG: hypothetical protein A2991_01765 [Candidatus Terrybacteria bacterium RIFCSPLOWO2_01_FULL_58_14]